MNYHEVKTEKKRINKGFLQYLILPFLVFFAVCLIIDAFIYLFEVLMVLILFPGLLVWFYIKLKYDRKMKKAALEEGIEGEYREDIKGSKYSQVVKWGIIFLFIFLVGKILYEYSKGEFEFIIPGLF